MGRGGDGQGDGRKGEEGGKVIEAEGQGLVLPLHLPVIWCYHYTYQRSGATITPTRGLVLPLHLPVIWCYHYT